MIEKPKRPRQLDIQDRQPPRALEELINRYDLDNTKIYDFLDELVGQLNIGQEEIQTQISEIIEKIMQETAWTNVTLNSGFTHGALASSGNLMYKRIGNIVYLKGSVKGFTASAQSCGTLPSGYRPATRIDIYVGTGSNYLAKGQIAANGNVALLGDTRNTYSADNWYAFCTSWVTDEAFPVE